MKKALWLILSSVSFVLLGFIYFDSHLDKIYVARADYYFRNNDIESAVHFYEKAFESGATDSKSRNNYVNLVINSPLNIEAQDRLVKFIKYSVEDDAKYRAVSFLSDLRAEIYRKYPDNYISQATYNQKIMRWGEPLITYGYFNQEDAPEYYIKAINNAFSVWEGNLDKKVMFKKSDKNPNILIRFNEIRSAADENEKYIAAYTQPVVEQGILKNMIINCYLKTPDGKNFSENQIYNNALHEIGHALGFMGHSDYKKNIMHMTSDTAAVTNDIRKSLTKSDINTMKLLYDTKPDITNTKAASGKYTRYLVIGNDAEVANAKIKEAKTYIKKAPNLTGGYIDLADAYTAREEYSKALKCLNKALMIAKDNNNIYMIYYNMALINYYLEDYVNAAECLKKSGAYQNSSSAKYLLAQIYVKSGKKDEAIGIYEDLILKNPSEIDYVIGLTNIYVKDKEYIKARRVLKEFVAKNPSERNNSRFAPYGIIRMFL